MPHPSLRISPRAPSALAFACVLGSAAVIGPARSAVAQTDAEREAVADAHYIAQVDVAIDRASGRRPHLRPTHREDEDVWGTLQSGASEVFFKFFSNIAPNPSGIERPTADEHMLDELEVPAGDRLSYVLMGAGNNHVLTDTHFYQQFDGILALRYDIVQHDDATPVRLSVTASPLSGSSTTIARHAGVETADELPTAVIVGGAAGIDISYDTRLVDLSARAYLMPGIDVGNAHSSGVAQLQSVQVILRLTEMLDGDRTQPVDLYLVGMHVERGDARSAVYAWDGEARGPAALREVWQAMAIFTYRRD
jgi:hypothetical protein